MSTRSLKMNDLKGFWRIPPQAPGQAITTRSFFLARVPTRQIKKELRQWLYPLRDHISKSLISEIVARVSDVERVRSQTED